MARFSILCAFLSLMALDAFAQPARPAQPPATPRVDALGDLLPEGALARIGTTRFRHGGGTLLGFGPDAKTLLYYNADSLQFFDVVSGKQFKAFRLTDMIVSSDRFGNCHPVLSGDGKVLAFAGQRGDSFVSIIDTSTGKERRRFAGDNVFKIRQAAYNLSLSLNDDGKVLLVTCGEHPRGRLPLRWFDTTTGKLLHEIAAEQKSYWMGGQISRDGKLAAAIELRAGERNKLRLRVFDAATGKQLHAVEAPLADLSFTLRPDGKTLLGTRKRLGGLHLYDFTAGKELKEVRAFSHRGAHALSRDGQQLFIGVTNVAHLDVDSGKQIRQFDADSGQRRDYSVRPARHFGFNELALSSDGAALALSGLDSFAVHDAATGKLLAGAAEPSAAVSVVRFTRDSRELVVGNGKPSPQLWNVQTALRSRTFDKSNPKPPRRGEYLNLVLEGAAFSNNGQLLAMPDGLQGLGVWNAITGKLLKTFMVEPAEFEPGVPEGPDDDVRIAFAISPHGNTLAIAQDNGILKFWDAATGKALVSWNWLSDEPQPNGDPSTTLFSLAYSPNGKVLAGIGDSNRGPPQTTVILWETETGKERLRFHPNVERRNDFLDVRDLFTPRPLNVQFSPDGKRLLLATGTSLRVLDALTGKEIVTYAGDTMFGLTATFSQDGKLLFVGLLDGILRVVDAGTAKALRDFPGHSESIVTMALSPDGKTLATGSTDSTVLLWDTAVLAQPPAAKTGLTAKELDRLWQELADPDAAKAFQAIQHLTAAPAEAVAFLRTHLKPIPAPDRKLIEQLLEVLNSEKFAEREKATTELEKLGDLAGPALRARVETKPSLEMNQRLDSLLAKLNGPVRSPDLLRMLRAVETLELIGTPAARELLVALARGAPGHRMTEDAGAALQRLKKGARH